jgi:hypothetical protein
MTAVSTLPFSLLERRFVFMAGAFVLSAGAFVLLACGSAKARINGSLSCWSKDSTSRVAFDGCRRHGREMIFHSRQRVERFLCDWWVSHAAPGG